MLTTTSLRMWTPRLRRDGALPCLILVLAFGFLGTRGIWDPDEGRYVNVALNMLDSGDWLNPRRNEDVGHWTKPPLTYWTLASSMRAFGANVWAARLVPAFAYLICALLCWRIARRIAPGTESTAAIAFATLLLPVGASQLITPDGLLAACEALAMWGYVEARFGATRTPRRWLLAMWAGFAFAFLCKGPPALLPLLVIVVYEVWRRDTDQHSVFTWAGLLTFSVLAMPWFVAVMLGNPGLFEYFIGDEVVNRIATNEFGRHGEWYGWIEIYAPTLAIGTLPWTATLWRWIKTIPDVLVRRRRIAHAISNERRDRLLMLWIALPLLAFCIARSRMPLYILPLFVPIALAIAVQRQREGLPFPSWRKIGAWASLVLLLKLASAWWPTHKNAADWAVAIRERHPTAITHILFVEDMTRYGLRLYLNAQIEKIELEALPRARFNPSYDESLSEELQERVPHALWICKTALWPTLRQRISSTGAEAIALGEPYRGRVMFRVRSARSDAPSPHARPFDAPRASSAAIRR